MPETQLVLPSSLESAELGGAVVRAATGRTRNVYKGSDSTLSTVKGNGQQDMIGKDKKKKRIKQSLEVTSIKLPACVALGRSCNRCCHE